MAEKKKRVGQQKRKKKGRGKVDRVAGGIKQGRKSRRHMRGPL